MVSQADYDNWIARRSFFKEYRFCYCGHTKTCDCANPSFDEFKLAVENKNIILNSPTNGWNEIEK